MLKNKSFINFIYMSIYILDRNLFENWWWLRFILSLDFLTFGFDGWLLYVLNGLGFILKGWKRRVGCLIVCYLMSHLIIFHHWQGRAAKFRTLLDTHGLWSERDLYRSMHALTWGFGFCSLIRRTTLCFALYWMSKGYWGPIIKLGRNRRI